MRPDLALFDYEHLPPHLQEVSRPFRELAHDLFATPTHGHDGAQAEQDVALRKLLEAKDAAVRVVVLLRKTVGLA